MYVVTDVLKSNISDIVRHYLLNYFQQPKNQSVLGFFERRYISPIDYYYYYYSYYYLKILPSQFCGIFFLIYKGHVMFYTSGEYNPINLISMYVLCIYSCLC